MTQHTFTMSETQARRVHDLASSHIQALKNWTASAVESGNLAKAQELVADMRAFQAIFAAFNITAKHDVAEATGKPLVTSHNVEERSR